MATASSSSRSGIAELKIDGVFYGGWKSLRVTRSIEQIAGTFDLEITERWPGNPIASPIKPGKRCQLLLDGEPVITGWVDLVAPDYDSNRHTIRVSGRDKTGDLVDCSAMHKSGQWANVTLLQLARDLLAPYDISVSVAAGVNAGSAFSSFNIQEGETVFECLDRAARMKALLLTSDALGNLVITRAGTLRSDYALVEGQNIKAARAEFSQKERFSRYQIKGQGRLGADGEQEHAAVTGVITDPAITRHRPLIVLAESHSNNTTLRDRAEWERNVRRGRGARGSITVQGWADLGGALWQPNTLIPVTSPLLWLKDAEPLLIVGCSYSLDEQGGTLTELAIARPESFQLLEGVAQSKLFGKLKTKEQREKREKALGWGEF